MFSVHDMECTWMPHAVCNAGLAAGDERDEQITVFVHWNLSKKDIPISEISHTPFLLFSAIFPSAVDLFQHEMHLWLERHVAAICTCAWANMLHCMLYTNPHKQRFCLLFNQIEDNQKRQRTTTILQKREQEQEGTHTEKKKKGNSRQPQTHFGTIALSSCGRAVHQPKRPMNMVWFRLYYRIARG